MRSLVRRLIEFAVLTVVLTWVWITWLQAGYTELVGWVGGPLLAHFGAQGVAESPAEKRFVSYVPFVVLMLMTPRLSWRRRLAGIGVGCGLIFACHLGLVVLEAFAQTAGRPTEDAFSTLLPAVLFADAFPFVLWALIAQEVLRSAFRRGRLPEPDADRRR